MAKTEESAFPKWWDFSDSADGSKLAGGFARAGRGHTQQGERTFVVLDVEGTERTLWLHHDVLQKAFARELHRRPSKRFEVGERIEVEQLGMRDSANGSSSYMNYKTTFFDGPEISQEDVFGPSPDGPSPNDQEKQSKSAEPGTGGGNGFDDDVPFAPQ
jgi:hypothetical protein